MVKWGSKCLQGLIRFFIFPVVVVYTRVLFFFFFAWKNIFFLMLKSSKKNVIPWFGILVDVQDPFGSSVSQNVSLSPQKTVRIDFLNSATTAFVASKDRRLLIASFISSDAEQTNADWFFCFELQSLLQSHHQRVLRGMFWFHYWTRSCHSHHWSSLAFWQGYTVAFCEYGLNNRNIVCKYRSLAC